MRNLTRTPGVADRDPAWSPDGKWIAWLLGRVRRVRRFTCARPTASAPCARSTSARRRRSSTSPRWSPDSKKIAYTDKRHEPVDGGPRQARPRSRSTRDLYDTPAASSIPPGRRTASGSPTRSSSATTCAAAFVYSGREREEPAGARTAAATPLSPRFDRSGKYLYFVATTSARLSQGWLDMTSMAWRVTSSVYAARARARTSFAGRAPRATRRAADDKAKDDKDQGPTATRRPRRTKDGEAPTRRDKKAGEKKRRGPSWSR